MVTLTGVPEKQVTIREWTITDLETTLHHRRMMFYDMGNRDEAVLSAMLATSGPFFAKGFRRQGIARRLMEIMIDCCRREGFGSVWLHASDDGRPVYEKRGFRKTNEMRLMLQ